MAKNKYPMMSNVPQMQKALQMGKKAKGFGSPMLGKTPRTASEKAFDPRGVKMKGKKMTPAQVQSRKRTRLKNAADKVFGSQIR